LRSIGPKSLYSATPLVFNSLDGGSPGTISVNFFTWMLTDGQRTKWRRKFHSPKYGARTLQINRQIYDR